MSRPLRDDDFTIDLAWRGKLIVHFITYFVVILTKTYAALASTSLLIMWDKTAAKKRWSLSKIVFLDVETTFRQIFPSSELQCFPRGDSRNLCANTRIRLLATNSLCRFWCPFFTRRPQQNRSSCPFNITISWVGLWNLRSRIEPINFIIKEQMIKPKIVDSLVY